MLVVTVLASVSPLIVLQVVVCPIKKMDETDRFQNVSPTPSQVSGLSETGAAPAPYPSCRSVVWANRRWQS
jgi:hypothetical protein